MRVEKRETLNDSFLKFRVLVKQEQELKALELRSESLYESFISLKVLH